MKSLGTERKPKREMSSIQQLIILVDTVQDWQKPL